MAGTEVPMARLDARRRVSLVTPLWSALLWTAAVSVVVTGAVDGGSAAVNVSRTASKVTVHTAVCLEPSSTDLGHLTAIDLRMESVHKSFLARVAVKGGLQLGPHVHGVAARGWLSDHHSSPPLVAVGSPLQITSLDLNQVQCEFSYSLDAEKPVVTTPDVTPVDAQVFRFEFLLPDKQTTNVSALEVDILTERGEVFRFNRDDRLHNGSLQFDKMDDPSDVTMYRWRDVDGDSDVILLTVIAAEGSPLAYAWKRFDCLFKTQDGQLRECLRAKEELDQGTSVGMWEAVGITIAISSVCVVLIVSVGGVFLWRRSRRHRGNNGHDDDTHGASSAATASDPHRVRQEEGGGGRDGDGGDDGAGAGDRGGGAAAMEGELRVPILASRDAGDFSPASTDRTLDTPGSGLLSGGVECV